MATDRNILALQRVVEFLPYNERVEMNRILPLHYRVVKKLNSDEHNFHVKLMLMKDKITKINSYEQGNVERLKTAKKMFLYFAHTKDKVLYMNETLRNTALSKAKEIVSGTQFTPQMILFHRREVKSLVRAAEELIRYFETESVQTRKMTYKLVEIK
jgi:hypothetical protein